MISDFFTLTSKEFLRTSSWSPRIRLICSKLSVSHMRRQSLDPSIQIAMEALIEYISASSPTFLAIPTLAPRRLRVFIADPVRRDTLWGQILPNSFVHIFLSRGIGSLHFLFEDRFLLI